jgi:hypothetical protein
MSRNARNNDTTARARAGPARTAAFWNTAAAWWALGVPEAKVMSRWTTTRIRLLIAKPALIPEYVK